MAKDAGRLPAPLPCGACGRRGCSSRGLLFVTREKMNTGRGRCCVYVVGGVARGVAGVVL